MTRRRPARLLVVEDDRTTAGLIALYLRHAGYRVEVEGSGDGALARLADGGFDLVVLDLMLPGVDGWEICRHLAGDDGGRTAVVMVTARGGEEERVAGLDLGADDYVTKPFSPRELVARVRAVLRRRRPAEEVIERGDLVIDLAAHRVTVAGRPVELTPSELALLADLASRPGRVRSRSRLLAALPGAPADTLERTVDVHVRNLRRKIEPDPAAPRYVETVLGAGYRFAPVEPSA